MRVRREDAHQPPGSRVVFAEARDSVWSAKGNSLATTMCPFGAIVRSSGLSSGSATKRRGRGAGSSQTRRSCYLLPRRGDAGGKVEPAVAPEAEPAWERNDASRQKRFWIPIESRGHGGYRPRSAHRDVVAAIWPERGTARIKSWNSPGVAHGVSEVIERQHAVLAAVEVDQRARRVKRETTRIGDQRIAAEWPKQLALAVEAENRAVATAVGAPALVTSRRTKSC